VAESIFETIVRLVNEKRTVTEIATELRLSRRHVQRLIAIAIRDGLLPPRPAHRPAVRQDERNRRRRDRYVLRRLAEEISKPGAAREIFRQALAELPAPTQAEAMAYVRGGGGDGKVVHSVPPRGEGGLVAAAIEAVEWFKRSRLRVGDWGVAPQMAREFLGAVSKYEKERKKLDRRAREVSTVVDSDPLLAAADQAGGLQDEALARLKITEEEACRAAKEVAAALLDPGARTIWPGGGKIGMSLQEWEEEVRDLQAKALGWARAVEAASTASRAEEVPQEPQAQAEPQPQAPEPEPQGAGDQTAKDGLERVDREVIEVLAEDQCRGREHHAEVVGIPRADRLTGIKPLIV